ncbi:uncharacterized protein KY384_005394 [Bacidia gigantensis]|uniref:uncharacterized protein n=1 Tax=Bacidia gigantensis TaxID=2732470 RepID=UPI001D039FFA|nr:uncharacterized protein KY384_005394 [Bacidia gigantensis]KAG8529913.1 hypothetical protein KY384_005394 [Bacidia gigantensis]
MGNDGGSIPTRRELVKEGAKDLTTTQVKELQNERLEHFWATCALSHEPLVQPVVSDSLGTLYNKSAVLDHLLAQAQPAADKDTLIKRGQAFKDRIRGLKDVVEVKFERDSDNNVLASRWICPITNKRLGPGTRAVYLVPCGHAFAESVVKEMQGDTCLCCDESYTTENIMPILPSAQAEKDRLERRLVDLKAKGLTHSLKKASGSSKKRKTTGPAENAPLSGDDPIRNLPPKSMSNGLKNADTAKLTVKVLNEQENHNKKRKMDTNENIKSLFSSKDPKDGKNTDFMTRGFSIPAHDVR